LFVILFLSRSLLSAWTDFDRVPRSTWFNSSTLGLGGDEEHHGSRRRLLFSRRENDRKICENKLDIARTMTLGIAGQSQTRPTTAMNIPPQRFGRSNLISDVRTENS
jgi:hypothetical protein